MRTRSGRPRDGKRSRRGPSGARPVEPDAPTGLVVELLDEEFAVFTWDVEPAPRAELLTAVEREVLALVIAGASNARIAEVRGTSVRTIANQVASVLRKLGASSRFDLARRFGGRSGET